MKKRTVIDSTLFRQFVGRDNASPDQAQAWLDTSLSGHNPIPILYEYFDHSVPHPIIQRYLSTEEEVSQREQLRDCLLQKLEPLFSKILGVTQLPQQLSEDRGRQIIDLFKEFKNENEYNYYNPNRNGGKGLQNPFNRLVSLKTLRDRSGLSSEQIAHHLGKLSFVWGDLVLDFNIQAGGKECEEHRFKIGPSRMKKKAIRESVHGNNGRRRLNAKAFPGNLKRLAQARRVIGVRISLIANADLRDSTRLPYFLK